MKPENSEIFTEIFEMSLTKAMAPKMFLHGYLHGIEVPGHEFLDSYIFGVCLGTLMLELGGIAVGGCVRCGRGFQLLSFSNSRMAAGDEKEDGFCEAWVHAKAKSSSVVNGPSEQE